jgi:DnaK suppressor protein
MRQFPQNVVPNETLEMSKKTLTEAERKRLQKEREQTQAELGRLREYLKAEPGPTGDEVDLAVYEREKNLALARRLEQKLEEIDKALETAKKGTYGICERCGKPIDPTRLEALPETTLCVKCKNELEKAARRARM